MKRDKIYIYGKHALAEALEHAPRTVRKVFLAEGFSDPDLMGLLSRCGISPDRLRSRELEKTVGKDTSHQGVIAALNPEELMRPFGEFIAGLPRTEEKAMVLLDGLEDPHNVGAVIRSAAAFGAAGVLLPSRRQAPITGAVVKVSAGMAFRVPLVSIGGTTAAISDLKREGFRVYGLAMEGTVSLSSEPFDAPSVFIIGNESKGISSKVGELCDATLSIPMHPRAESLNAAVSAAVVLYQWSTRHPAALR